MYLQKVLCSHEYRHSTMMQGNFLIFEEWFVNYVQHMMYHIHIAKHYKLCKSGTIITSITVLLRAENVEIPLELTNMLCLSKES